MLLMDEILYKKNFKNNKTKKDLSQTSRHLRQNSIHKLALLNLV